jgi:hypothetical protein
MLPDPATWSVVSLSNRTDGTSTPVASTIWAVTVTVAPVLRSTVVGVKSNATT